MTAPANPVKRTVVADGGIVRIGIKTEADLRDDYGWRTDEETARFDGLGPLDVSFAEYVERMLPDILYPGPAKRAFSLDAPDGRHIGNVMYYNVSYERDSAEIGISIGDESLRGQGIGTAAVVAFVRYLWATHSFRRLFLHTLEWNERARACFRRSGFDEVARVIRNGEPFIQMEVRREWWLMWDAEGRFEHVLARPGSPPAADS